MYQDLYFDEVVLIAQKIDRVKVSSLVDEIVNLRENKGRLFFIGIGGSAGNTSHAVNDFRKLCGIESYSLTDNVSEFTARVNDEGWETVFTNILEVSNPTSRDGIFVLSVGGGNEEKEISINIVNVIKYAKNKNLKVFGIVGKSDGYAAQHGDLVVIIPEIDSKRTTPHSESFQSVVWHCVVTDPKLQTNPTKW
jgi:D-sedoheptulose 7-phosphate isomerase